VEKVDCTELADLLADASKLNINAQIKHLKKSLFDSSSNSKNNNNTGLHYNFVERRTTNSNVIFLTPCDVQK